MNSTLKKSVSLLQLVFFLFLFLLAFPGRPDDTEIYDMVSSCGVQDSEKYRFIFVVDNSGSMSSWEFLQSRQTINNVINEVLESDLNDIQVAVVQYGTNNSSNAHKYNVTVPFTDNASVATSWNRYYGPGTSRSGDYEDHQPASLSKMRLDKVYDAGNALDVSDATNVQIVFFTDAWRNVAGACCSSLVSVNQGNNIQGNLSNVYAGFGEYDALKNGSVLPNGLKAQFTILHVPPDFSSSMAAAAIASPGGNYMGSVEYNSGDPEGPGTRPRRYVQGSFSSSDTSQIVELVKQVIEEVKAATYTSVAPTISVNAFNELQHRDEIYFSVYEPGNRPRWNGNIKKFRINSSGVILDSTQTAAIDAVSGSVSDTARSYWSAEEDGPDVYLGGYRSKLSNDQVIYTDPTAFEETPSDSGLQRITGESAITLESLDLSDTQTDGQCVLVGDKVNGVLTVSTTEISTESDLSVEPGYAKLALMSTEAVSVKVVVKSDSASNADQTKCTNSYEGSSELRTCSFTISNGYESLDLLFEASENDAEVEYIVEYNIPQDFSSSTCVTARQQRTEILTWLTGKDIFNEDADDSIIDAHLFAADPLHSKPVVLTFSGESVETARDVLFVTDNLGMLHAIDPADDKGTKLWSYIPEEHLDNPKKVVYDKAGQPKVYGLDGYMSVVQREAENSTSSDFELEDVSLYVGERRGGRNYYAFDLSDTGQDDSKPVVDWKIQGGKSVRFDDLGETWSRMLPHRIAYNCNSQGAGCTFLEVLVFSGGYDAGNDAYDYIPTGTLGNALYIVDLETGGDNFFWSAGNNNDARNKHTHNLDLPIEHSVVATPSIIDSNGDGAIDILFAVDISGAIWRVDLGSSVPESGESTSASSGLVVSGGQIADLSSAEGIQRFYNSLDVSRTNPRSGVNKFAISTGSGFRAHPNDMSDTYNKLFVVLDPNTYSLAGNADESDSRYNYVEGKRIIAYSDLVDASASETEGEVYDPVFGLALSASSEGEKFLQPSITINGTLIISSFVPGDNTSESCSIGNGRTYFLDLLTLQSRFASDYVDLTLPGIPPETSILRLPGISICVGTSCASAGSESSEDDDDCDPSLFDSETYDSDFAAGVSAAICGLETGRAYRSSWLER